MIVALSFVVRVLVILFLLRLVSRVVGELLRPRRPERREESVDLVRDRVCNTFLPRSRAVRAMVAGREEHFCSAACARRALSESSGSA